MLATAIKVYRKNRAVNLAVRAAVRLHHKIRPSDERRPCPLGGQCSAVGLAQAQAMGMAALPVILARMSLCGPGADESPHCRPASGTATCWDRQLGDDLPSHPVRWWLETWC